MRTSNRDFSMGETVSPRPWWPAIRQTAPLRSATRIPSARVVSPLLPWLVPLNEGLLSSSRFYKYAAAAAAAAVDETRGAIVRGNERAGSPKRGTMGGGGRGGGGGEREITPGRDVRYEIISRCFTATGQIARRLCFPRAFTRASDENLDGFVRFGENSPLLRSYAVRFT